MLQLITNEKMCKKANRLEDLGRHFGVEMANQDGGDRVHHLAFLNIYKH